MNDMPKCPYCGAQMERITGRYLDGQYKSRYCCPKCDACTPPGDFCDQIAAAQESALAAALRRAEPCATYSQVNKALCGMENATVDEMLRVVEQLNRRAEPENRVLGLGEAQRICAKGDAVWLEEMALTIPTWLSDMTLAHVSFFGRTNQCLLHTHIFATFPLMAEKYGKTWRCWLRKPTAEEMEGEKWGE